MSFSSSRKFNSNNNNVGSPSRESVKLPPINNSNSSPRAAARFSSSSVISPPTNHLIADAILDKISSQVRDDRLVRNKNARGHIEYAERTQREEVITQFYEYFHLLAGHLAHIEDKNQKQKPIHARAVPGFCLSRLEQRIADQAKKDSERELWCREEGKRQLALDQEKNRQDLKRREEMKRRLREDMVGFRAAGVFLIAEETRQRAMMDNEMGNSLQLVRKRFAEEEFAAMKAMADREAREEAARQSVIATAKKEAASLDEKRQAEVQRRQQKLIGKCTHARNGTSVFVGAYPKKMCLICRIKLDPISGLYAVMEGHVKK